MNFADTQLQFAGAVDSWQGLARLDKSGAMPSAKSKQAGKLRLAFARLAVAVASLASSAALAATVEIQNAATAEGWHFSSVATITRNNVGDLKPAWHWNTGRQGVESGAPVLAGDALMLLTPFPPALAALDPTTPEARIDWQMVPKAEASAESLRCCGVQEHGPVVAGGRLFITTLDGHVLSLDATTGQVRWNATVADASKGESLSGPPTVANDRLLVGGGNGDFGTRGWIVALDLETGATRWKRFSTGPDGDVGIGARFQSSGAGNRGPDLGVESWPPSAWEHGGGAVDGPILVDPATNLIFHGTGRPAPWNAAQRAGDNRWTSGLFARDAGTGEARWFMSLNPHDPFGWGGLGPNILVDRDWEGSPRKLLVHADANGFLYVLDRMTGKVLAVDPFAKNNVVRSIDSSTGYPVLNDAKLPHTNVQVRDVCPAWTGAVGASIAFSPDTGFVYIPVNALCMDIEARQANFIAGTPFIGANIRAYPPRDGNGGALLAWDVAAGKPAWIVAEKFPLAGGVLATAGRLIFYGTLDGTLKAVDAETGNPLWQFDTGSTLVGQPTLFEEPDGRPTLAAVAGPGGPLGLALSGETDSLDASAALGLAHALGDLPKPADARGTLWLFRLP